MSRLRLLLALLVSLSVWTQTAAAIVFDLPVVFDANARDNLPADGSFDSVTSNLIVADARIQNPGVPGATIEDRIVMEFDLAGLAAVSSIGSAILILPEVHDDGAPLGLYGGAGNGTAEASDAEVAAFISGPVGLFGDATTNLASVDVTALIESLFQSGDPYALFAIRGGDVELGTANAVHYRIGTTFGGTSPILRIDGKAVPEPSTAALVAAGLLAAAAVRTRRQR